MLVASVEHRYLLPATMLDDANAGTSSPSGTFKFNYAAI
jgi:hypothetical protein